MDGQRLAAAPNGGTYMSETTDGPQQQPHLRRSAARRRTDGRPNPSRSSERSESSERRPGSEVSQEDGELPIGGVDPFGEPPTLLELVCRVRDARYNDAMLDRSLTFEERAPMANSRARAWHEHGMRLTRGSRTDRFTALADTLASFPEENMHVKSIPNGAESSSASEAIACNTDTHPVDTEGYSWATPLSPCNLQELPHREDRLQLGAGEPACAAFVRGQGAEGRRLVADSQAVD